MWNWRIGLDCVGVSLVAQTVKICLSMQETQVWSLSQKDSLEKEMATHSTLLTWKIPWEEGPGGLLSMGSQSWHDWACMDDDDDRLFGQVSFGHIWTDFNLHIFWFAHLSQQIFTNCQLCTRARLSARMPTDKGDKLNPWSLRTCASRGPGDEKIG